MAFQFDLEFGILMIILGVIVLFNPKNLMVFICIALGISILLDGLFKIRIAMDSRQFGIKSWWLILSLAIVTRVIGVFLIFESVIGSHVLSVLLGLTLLSEGILNLYTAISTVLIVKNQAPDVIEVEAFEIDGKERYGLTTRLRSTIDVSHRYKSFAGASEDMDGQVKFIYRTDAVE